MRLPCPEPDCDRRRGHKRKHRCREYGVDQHGPWRGVRKWVRTKTEEEA